MNIRFGTLLLTTVLTNAIAADWFAKESRWAGHDPDIIRYEDGYALATTDNHMLMQFSEDALNWKNGELAMPKFSQWLYKYAPNMIDIWAPDIHYIGGNTACTIAAPRWASALRAWAS